MKPLGVRGVGLYETSVYMDYRGSLTFYEVGKPLLFVPKRCFMSYDVPGKEVRGAHAHKECHQFLVCVRGSCSVIVDDGENRAEVLLDRPNLGLHLPAMVWATEYNYSPDGILLVLASDLYKEEDYIRDYAEFLKAVGAARGS